MSIEHVRALLAYGRDPTRECGLDCPGYVIMERSDNGLFEIERCDVCVGAQWPAAGDSGIYDDDVAQLPEARELFRKVRAEERGRYRRRHHRNSWPRVLSKKERSNFMRDRSRARAALRRLAPALTRAA